MRILVAAGCAALVFAVVAFTWIRQRDSSSAQRSVARPNLFLSGGVQPGAVAPTVHIDRAPHIGSLTFGAFAPEAAPSLDLSIEALADQEVYVEYRQSVRADYGCDLADMNYLGVGVGGWQRRYSDLEKWLLRAGQYGDPTVAVEPVGPDGYGIFSDGPEMADLRSVFLSAKQSGITVWVRFASESNLKYSTYSIYNDPVKIAQYRHSVRWFRGYMPSNVKIVFSPLINTAYLQDPRQIRTLREMYDPGAYDRIGGTLYATSWCRPRIAFNWYYHFMRQVDATTPFQICELGGIYPRADEIRAFILRAARGDWPGVQRINLFAGDLNPLAVNEHGHFGFILPSQSSSYLSDLLSGAISGSELANEESDGELARLEDISSGWQSPSMTLEGTIASRPIGSGAFFIEAVSVTDDLGTLTTLNPPRIKKIIPTDDCYGAISARNESVGTRVQVVGWDSGSGTALRACQISIEPSQYGVGL